MFGHERGGVTGSRTAHVGLVEQAGGGTLFLDEVSALPQSLQGKLLRLLEDGSYRRLGGTQELVSEARIVSSSNADLPALVAKGNFRADLYYRLERDRAADPTAAELGVRISFLLRSIISRSSPAAPATAYRP